MSLTLITGVPGSGKSVYALTFIKDLLSEGRPLYVHGIPNLSIEHQLVVCSSPSCEVCPSPPVEPIEPDEIDWTVSHDIKSQYDIDIKNHKKKLARYLAEKIKYDNLLKADEWNLWAPDGALLIYDEVQNVYRPRSSSAKVPPSVAAFETHRHKGLDFYLVTQSPLLFDGNIRRLIGRHIHLRPTWAGRFQYEFPECNDNTKSVSSGVKSKYKLDKSVFGLYKSSSLHTKQMKKIPSVLYVLVFLVIGLMVLGYRVKDRYDTVAVLPDAEQPALLKQEINHLPANLLKIEIPDIIEDKIYTVLEIQKASYFGVDMDSLDRLPSSCHIFSTKSIKCFVDVYYKKLYKSFVCIPNQCYTLIKIKQKEKPRNEYS